MYIFLLGFLILSGYLAGIFMEGKGERKRSILVGHVVLSIGILLFFKYSGFIHENISFLLGLFGSANPIPAMHVLYPVGLSFMIFQSLCYGIEVYRGNLKAERNPGFYSLYVSFYPKLLAGPIERPQNLLPQFRKWRDFDYESVASGLKLMAWGMFKKTVIADRLAVIVNEVYGHPVQYRGFPLILATVLFSFQIYSDFSGYTDIARGAARVAGIRLMDNFAQPYFSLSIADFWRRWHISLSSWFRDYLYIPMGGGTGFLRAIGAST
jgi:alginate O-acetyltransferase complex protein AlgI